MGQHVAKEENERSSYFASCTGAFVDTLAEYELCSEKIVDIAFMITDTIGRVAAFDRRCHMSIPDGYPILSSDHFIGSILNGARVPKAIAPPANE